MAIYTVDTIEDAVDAGDGRLSLREALALADATGAADSIQFAEAVQGGTIVLAGSELTVASQVTIDGGDGVTIDAGGRSRVLLVQEPEGQAHAWITLAHLTITGGRTRDGQGGGAGIYSAARYDALTLDHVTVVGNRAAGSGGGISGFYGLVLSDSTVAGNSAAGRGGGIDGRYVSLVRSTVSDNEIRGGHSNGGGIYAGIGAYLYDSTVSGNRSGCGLVSDGWTFVTNSTISGNERAGIDADYSHFYIRNSIVVGNDSDSSAPSEIVGGITGSNGCNIFGSEVTGATPSDRQNVAPEVVFASIDPRTGGGLLADHGGPTQTIALRDAADNLALGGADPESASETDQRGVVRPQPAGSNPDIGAFELDQPNPMPPVARTFVVTSTSDAIADDGVLTLREALALANLDSVTMDRIELAPNLAGETIRLSGGQLTVNTDIVIDGAGVTIDAAGASRVLLAHGLETDITLRDLTITGGRTTDDYAHGGGVRAEAGTRLTLERVSVVGNSSYRGSGGGISGYDVTLTNSTVSGNSAAYSGGGVHGAAGHRVTLINSTITGNSAMSGGGIDGDDLAVTNSIVAGNSSADGHAEIGFIGASNGHNIFGSEVAGSAPGDLENIPASFVFAAIDPTTGGGLLADHGGPTPTIALRDAWDNPALGGADPAGAPATDQRGVARPSPAGTDPDIGAFEHPWLSGRADALEYVASYPDLIRALGPDAAAGAAHYRHYGAAEGRQVQFDGLEYIASHDDLIAALGPDAAAGAVHFIRYGAGEGRPPDEFDAEQYLANYADLQAAFGDDAEAATAHFIRYGHAEGRSDDPLSARAAADFLI